MRWLARLARAMCPPRLAGTTSLACPLASCPARFPTTRVCPSAMRRFIVSVGCARATAGWTVRRANGACAALLPGLSLVARPFIGGRSPAWWASRGAVRFSSATAPCIAFIARTARWPKAMASRCQTISLKRLFCGCKTKSMRPTSTWLPRRTICRTLPGRSSALRPQVRLRCRWCITARATKAPKPCVCLTGWLTCSWLTSSTPTP